LIEDINQIQYTCFYKEHDDVIVFIDILVVFLWILLALTCN